MMIAALILIASSEDRSSEELAEFANDVVRELSPTRQ
jgi:hypothetical protein